MVRVGIIGVAGYVGIELLRILQQHPNVKITQITTESYPGQDIAQVFPHLAGKVNQTGTQLDLNAIIQNCDVVFISLPHGHSATIAASLMEARKRVIDLGADFRLKKSADFQKWYNQQSAPETLLSKAVYGLPETTNKDAITKAQLIANPGCMPTACILSSAPLIKAKIIQQQDCIFDVKIGMSSTGRKPGLYSHFCEIAENIIGYNLSSSHRHTPEIEQELGVIANTPITVQLIPHQVPIIRGILATAYLKLNKEFTAEDLQNLYKKTYQNEPFIRISNSHSVANPKNVKGTNFCDISIHVNKRTQHAIVISSIDNLIKGGAGQAIQNMNLMYGFPETTGLDQFISIYP